MTEALERNSRRLLVGALLVLSAVAWLVTVRNARSMADMAMGLGQVGTRMESDVGVPLFFAMWVAMMVAMMFPTVAPLVLAHRMVVSRRNEHRGSTAVLVGGYLLSWTVAGVVPFAALAAFRSFAGDGGDWIRIAAGGVIAGAGAYQFTPWKATCLKACRSPVGFLMTHDFRGGSRSALRAGVSHGLYCLGCCWALMSVLVVVGMMNLVWMGVLAVIFLAEKTWRHGVGLTRVVGVALIALGIAIVAAPDLLPALSGGGPDAAMEPLMESM